MIFLCRKRLGVAAYGGALFKFFLFIEIKISDNKYKFLRKRDKKLKNQTKFSPDFFEGCRQRGKAKETRGGTQE